MNPRCALCKAFVCDADESYCKNCGAKNVIPRCRPVYLFKRVVPGGPLVPAKRMCQSSTNGHMAFRALT